MSTPKSTKRGVGLGGTAIQEPRWGSAVMFTRSHDVYVANDSTMRWLLLGMSIVSSLFALMWGYRGLAIREHVLHCSFLGGAVVLLLSVLVLAVRRARRVDLILLIAIPGIATPLASLAVGQLVFLRDIRPSERFFERSLPVIDAIHARTGTFPASFAFPCNDVPALLRNRCVDGVISDAYAPHAEVDFIISFDPHRHLYAHDPIDWSTRGFFGTQRQWSWGLAD